MADHRQERLFDPDGPRRPPPRFTKARPAPQALRCRSTLLSLDTGERVRCWDERLPGSDWCECCHPDTAALGRWLRSVEFDNDRTLLESARP